MAPTRNYGALVTDEAPSAVSSGYKIMSVFLVLAVSAPLSVLYFSDSKTSATILLSKSGITNQRALSALDTQIAKDEHLLQAQESLVNKAERLLMSRLHKSVSSVIEKKTQRLAPLQNSAAGHQTSLNNRPPAGPWTETVPDHSHVYLQSSLSAPDEAEEVDSDKIADWNAFFDSFTKRVDVPKWDKKDVLADNLDGITPCNIDCSKEGTTDLSDFAFFDNMTRVEVDDMGREHLVDSLDGIDACSIDC